jgi:hypothetical protein
MRCRTCEYALWNLRWRECPECGTPFRPSEFDFAPMSVRFCRPSCGQEYYGTGPRGHLSPSSKADPGLWLVVWAPLPSSPAWGAYVPGPTVTVATLGGQVVTFQANSLGMFLAEQNALRAVEGLPPLPDPQTVGTGP